MATQGIFSLGESELELSNGAWSSDPQYGYYFGGRIAVSPSAVSSIRRIDFSNDSPGFSSRGTIIIGRRYTNATGNEDYGWWGGGITDSANESRFERLEFANDLSTSSVRGNLSVADYQSNGVTNKSTGH